MTEQLSERTQNVSVLNEQVKISFRYSDEAEIKKINLADKVNSQLNELMKETLELIANYAPAIKPTRSETRYLWFKRKETRGLPKMLRKQFCEFGNVEVKKTIYNGDMDNCRYEVRYNKGNLNVNVADADLSKAKIKFIYAVNENFVSVKAPACWRLNK